MKGSDMHDLKSFEPGASVEDNLSMARYAANIGDVAHTVLHAQEAVCQSVEALMSEIAALRRELAARLP
jgi:hypothetical protein